MWAWLPGVLTAVALSLIGQAVLYGRVLARLDGVIADVDELNETKMTKDVHAAVTLRLDGRVDGALQEISRERHRVNNIEQRHQN